MYFKKSQRIQAANFLQDAADDLIRCFLIKAPPVPKYERRRIAVPLSFITQGALDGGQAEGFCIPRAPGRTSQLPPQARLQPMTRPLCPLGKLLLFPFITLLDLPQYISRN